MHVKELADLGGTTVRTVRYYHQIGLLPLPLTSRGRRDYDMTHVARLTRIRWLAQAGVPLSRISGMLDRHAAGDAVLADLRATVGAIDEQLTDLAAQRERMVRLVTAAERGDVLSPMPAVVAQFYDDLAGRAGDEQVRRAIRRERDFMELAYYRGDMPPEAEVVYRGLTEARLADSLTGFRSIAGRDAPGGDVQAVAAGTVRAALERLGPALPRLAASVDPALARRAADLYVRVSGGDALARAIADAFITAIEEVRNR